MPVHLPKLICFDEVNMNKPRSDLLCENCTLNEATHLVFFERYYKESGRTSLINPLFVCDKCIVLYKCSSQLFENRPRIVPFEKIGTWDERLMGLTSKKRWEFSAFRNPFLRKKLHRIRYIWKKTKKQEDQE